MISDEHEAHEGQDLDDTQRDVIALYRAILAGDPEATVVIFTNTRCMRCLGALSMLTRLWLGDLIDDEQHWPEAEAELARMLADLTGETAQ